MDSYRICGAMGTIHYRTLRVLVVAVDRELERYRNFFLMFKKDDFIRMREII